jgi:8-oxo-dGTP pyrophosphatase MutT (NUDIX family)
VIREAASIILLRRTEPGFSPGSSPAATGAASRAAALRAGAGETREGNAPSAPPSGFEVFFLRRHRKSSFMASAYVFPGGAAEPGEDARTAAARELFEEAGVLLAKHKPDRDEVTVEFGGTDAIRSRILAGGAADEALDLAGLVWATEGLVPWSHWITPSIEPKRFSARFFVVELPAGQEPHFDATETVDQVWVTPSQAIERAAELQLPPPQVRTCWELAQYATLRDVLAAGRQRADEPHPIMPRLAPGDGPCLLLPWDPEYLTKGTGESTPLTYKPRWAVGPSRFVMENRAWKHVAAAGSTTAG